jgi:hypothetical protein
MDSLVVGLHGSWCVRSTGRHRKSVPPLKGREYKAGTIEGYCRQRHVRRTPEALGRFLQRISKRRLSFQIKKEFNQKY